MYLRGCVYGRLSRVIYFPGHQITPRLPCPPELRRGPLGQSHFAYRGISLRPSHAAAAEKEEKEQEHLRKIDKTRRTRYTFIRFDIDQHDVGVESRETWERERYGGQIANFLPTEPTLQAKAEKSQWHSSGEHKADKLFINKLLKDKGLQSQNWRIALSDLVRHSTFEKTDELEDVESQELRGSDVDEIPVRRVTSESRNYRSFRLARHIYPPAKWSEASLAVYVEALVYSQRTQDRVHWQKPLLKGWSNVEDVVFALESVFYSTALRRFLSIKACNIGLRFFYECGMLARAQALYIRMEDLKMNFTTETFNILLRESASRMDAHNFTFLLHLMTRRGFKPNEVTWTLCLRVFDSSDVRAIIVRKMAESNMLDNDKIRRIVATHMIPDEIDKYLCNGHDYHSFLDYMSNKYGVGWLSTIAGNRLLYEVTKRQSTAESLNLLYEMKQTGFTADEISINTLLGHCLSSSKQCGLAFEILAVFKNLYRQYPGPQTYETLFRYAWRNRLLNLAIVIWRTAAIYGAVSSEMKARVFQSLLLYTPALDNPDQSDDPVELSNSSRSTKFRKFVGRFVIGLDAARGAATSQAMKTLKLSSYNKPRKWAQFLLATSLRIGRTCYLVGDLSEKLGRALEMDATWNAAGLYKKNDWRQMLHHAIAVYVRVKRRRLRRHSPRFRKHVIRRNSAPRRLTRRKNLPKVPNQRNSLQSRRGVQKCLRNRGTKSLRKANFPVRSRPNTRPVQFVTQMSTMWHRPQLSDLPALDHVIGRRRE